MNYVFGALAGLVWGALAALLNCRISLRAIRKNSEKSVVTANFLRILIDIAALGAIFLLRNLLPFSMELALVGTAISLSLITILFAYRVASGKLK